MKHELLQPSGGNGIKIYAAGVKTAATSAWSAGHVSRGNVTGCASSAKSGTVGSNSKEPSVTTNLSFAATTVLWHLLSS